MAHGAHCWPALCGAAQKSAGGMRVTMSRCGAVTSHKWYSGPMCKNCYRRNQTGRRTQSKMAKTEDARTESGGDMHTALVCLKVSAARLSVIPRALVDRSNLPPDSDDDEGDKCVEYDVYGWFKFESDANGVQRLDRQWVPLHDLEQVVRRRF